MRRQKWILVLLAAILAPGAAFAAPDFSAHMQGLTTVIFGGDPVFLFFDPATADLNENGVLDATEFELLEEVMDGAEAYTAATNAAQTQNAAYIDANLTTLAAGLGQTGSFDIAVVLGGYMTLGGERNWNLVNTIFTASNRATGAATFTPNRGAFDESQGEFVGACGDADDDGVRNLEEALAAANAAAYAAAALDEGTTDAGEDTIGGCIFKFDGEPGPIESRHWYYNPDNGNVYFVGSDYQGNIFSDQLPAMAANLTVNGLLIENAAPVRINDADENAFIAGLRSVDNDSEEAGVQLGDASTGANDVATEGTWKWADGTTFWIGAAAGAAQGGLYTNWNGGEPNNSNNEDYMEIRFGSGGWNDHGADDQQRIIIEIEGDFTDTNEDGIPNQWTDSNEDGLPDGLSVATVNITGPTTVTEGQTITLSASSEPGDIYTWTSADEGIATVEETGASVDVTGVSAGTVEISVEVLSVAKGLGSTGSVEIEVLEAQWFDLCEIEDTFQSQGEFLASQVGEAEPGPGDLPLDFNEWDADGDDLPDAWALRLLAYALCEGGVGLAKTGSPAGAVAAYNANAAVVATLADQLNNPATGVTQFLTAIINNIDDIAALGAAFSGNPCNGALAGFGIPDLNAQLLGIAALLTSLQGDLEDVIDAAPVVLAIPDLITGLVTVSTELGFAIGALLPIGDIQDALGDLSDITFLLGAIATNLGACPGGVAASAGAIYTDIGATPDLDLPAYAAYQDDAKLAGEPLAGAGDYDGDGVTNGEAAQIVIANGGDGNDFIIASTGDFGPFWAGNPALPVGGMVGLGVLFSAMGAAGAVVLRRKK